MKEKTFLLFITCFFSINALFAQSTYTLDNSETADINNIEVLADKDYSFEQILHDTSLHFIHAEKIAVKGLNYYWLKCTIKNPSVYDEKYSVWASPSFDNVLYVYNYDSAKWLAVKGGHMVSNNSTVFNFIPCLLRADTATTFYIKVNVTAFNNSPYSIDPVISIEKSLITQTRKSKDYVWWLVTILIVLSFFIYNAYLYFMFKDRVYLYYLLILSGGILYITGVNFYVCLFTEFKYLSAHLNPNGSFRYMPTDKFVGHAAIIIVLTGMVQFARHYLQTAVYLHFWDKLLKYALLIFITFQTGVIILEAVKLPAQNDIFLLVTNIIALIVIILMLAVGVAGYRKGIKQAKYYLIAQALPLLIMTGLVIYLLPQQQNHDWVLQILPNVAIIVQTLTFAIALVARVNLLKNDLHLTGLENQKIAGQIAIEQERNTRLEEKIEFDKRDIAAAQQIKLLMKELHHRVKNNLQIVSSLLSLQSFRIKDKAASEAVKEGQHRIEAMSLIHQRLYTHDDITQVNIKEFITDISESLMQAYGYNSHNFVLNLNIENEMMDVDKAIPLSLIINELVTNAFKYAYPGTANPALTITLTKAQSNMQLCIADNGKGIDIDAWKNNAGYGKELVQTFTKQLDGQVTVTIDKGTTFKIDFPVVLHNS